MPTKLVKLDPENRESLHRLLLQVYLDGQCYEFAVALHRGLGWALVGLVQDGVIRHALALSGDMKLWDARGIVKETQAGKPFGVAKIGPGMLLGISEKDLCDTRPVHKEAIGRASLFAQALWPELPWRKGTFHTKALSFMNDLEAICRKHKVWIRAPFPAANIVLSEMHGDEKGFTLSPTNDGQYLFDRIL